MNAGIITVTLNPAIDETLFLDRLVPGSVNRARLHHRQAGGKGVNVSAMLGRHGIPTIATGFLGADNPALFEDLFRETRTRDAFIRIPGETRSGIKIVAEAVRETTDINFPGARPGEDDLVALMEKLRELARPGDWVVVGGSLPAGMEIGHFIRLLGLIKKLGARLAVDTSGPPLLAAIQCGADLIKPNHHELEEILGRSLPDMRARIDAALAFQRSKVPHVILSLGADGALFASPDGLLLAAAPPVQVVSTVGAGDALLAGYLAGLTGRMDAASRARLATTFAWCAIEDVRRKLPDAAEIAARSARIEVKKL